MIETYVEDLGVPVCTSIQIHRPSLSFALACRRGTARNASPQDPVPDFVCATASSRVFIRVLH